MKEKIKNLIINFIIATGILIALFSLVSCQKEDIQPIQNDFMVRIITSDDTDHQVNYFIPGESVGHEIYSFNHNNNIDTTLTLPRYSKVLFYIQNQGGSSQATASLQVDGYQVYDGFANEGYTIYKEIEIDY